VTGARNSGCPLWIAGCRRAEAARSIYASNFQRVRSVIGLVGIEKRDDSRRFRRIEIHKQVVVTGFHRNVLFRITSLDSKRCGV